MYLYAQGQSTRTIQATLKRLYGAEVSSTLISEVTASVLEEVNAWQGRPLESVYPIVYFDVLFVKSREEGAAKTRAVYVALAIDMQGEKQVLGLCIAPTEGAVSWLNIFSELQARGMQDCFIACVDGLKGLPEAIETIYPRARVQLCIVHQVRKSLRYVSWKERKQVAAGLRAIYAAPSEETALSALDTFEATWSEKYAAIAPLWRKDWARLAPFFDYPPAIRKAIYTTNAVESLNYSLRRIVKDKGAFPNDEGNLQTAMARPAGSLEEVEATHTRLEGRAQPVRHTLRGPCPRNGPKKLDSFSSVFKCTVASGYAALGSGFRL